jgi:hypothetical protein
VKAVQSNFIEPQAIAEIQENVMKGVRGVLEKSLQGMWESMLGNKESMDFIQKVSVLLHG